MNEFLIKNYIDNMKTRDLVLFAKNQGIILNNNEAVLIYDYLKKYWRDFLYGNPKGILDKLKTELSLSTYNKIEQLYINNKNKFYKNKN